MTTPQHGSQRHHNHHSSVTGRSVYWGTLCLLSVALLSGCVSSGKYEAEKARALNFQRLLAQEEKLADELKAQLEEAKSQVETLEAQNRDVTVEMEALRSKTTSPQEDAAPGDVPAPPSSDLDVSQEDEPLSEESLAEFGLDDLSFDETDFADIGGEAPETGAAGEETGAIGEATYHTVVQGETLYRISRKYGVTVRQLKLWNKLSSNNILIGQRLIVSQP